MKKSALISVISLTLVTPLLSQTLQFVDLLGKQIYAQDSENTYLGTITTNRFDRDSIISTFGDYGSQFSSTSIRNNFSAFGSSFGTYSAYNDFASSPPVIVDYNPFSDEYTFIAYLTKNSIKFPRVDPDALIAYLEGPGPLPPVTPLLIGESGGFRFLSANSVQMYLSSVLNPTLDMSGYIRVDLWAFPAPYDGSGNLLSGYLLSSVNLPSLGPGEQHTQILEEDFILILPDGEYHVAMILFEEAYGRTREVDFRNFQDTIIIPYIPEEFTITVSAQEGGSVMKSPDSQTHAEGTVVTLTAFPERGFRFTGWTGGIESPESPFQFLVSNDLQIEASFESVPRHVFQLDPGDGYSLSVEPERDFYLPGEVITLTADLQEGFELSGWNVDGVPEGTSIVYTFPDIDEDTITSFEPEVKPLFDVAIVQNYEGDISSSRALTGISTGEEIAISFTPARGVQFIGWSGDLESADNPVTFVVESDMELILEAENLPEINLLTLLGQGFLISRDLGGPYFRGETVTLSIEIDEDYEFLGWEEPLEGQGMTASFTFTDEIQGNTVTIAPIVRPVAESSPWSDFENFDGWLSGWLGWIQELSPDYIYHLNLGTAYVSGDSSQSLWLYLFAQNGGWIWMGEDLYPFMYSPAKGWMMHLENSSWMLIWESGEWIEVLP